MQSNRQLNSSCSRADSLFSVSSSIGSIVSLTHPVKNSGDRASIFSQTIEEPILEGVSNVWDQLGEGLEKYYGLDEEELDKLSKENEEGSGWRIRRFIVTVRAVLRIERFKSDYIGKRFYTEAFHDRVNVVNYSKNAGSCLLGEEIHNYIPQKNDQYEMSSVFLPVGTIGMVVGEVEIVNGQAPFSHKVVEPFHDPFPLPIPGRYYIVLGSIPFNYRGSNYFLFHQNEINRLDHMIWSGGGDERVKLYNVSVS